MNAKVKFTKGHFEAVAAKFRRAWEWVDNGHSDAYKAGYHSAIVDIAQVFERSNKLFDRERFFKACGVAETRFQETGNEN